MRPNQHPQFLAWADSTGIDPALSRAILRIILAPPNLRFLAVIANRLATFALRYPDALGDLPPPFSDPENLLDLCAQLRRLEKTLPETLNADVVAVPSDHAHGGRSPLNRYCLTDFPIWSALINAPSAPGARAAYDRITAHAIGRMIRFASREISAERWREFLVLWQERHKLIAASSDPLTPPPVPHPLPHSTLYQIELRLRQLASPDHEALWSSVDAEKNDESLTPSDLSTRFEQRFEKGSRYLREIARALDALSGDEPEAAPGFTRLRTARRPIRLGGGRFVSGLDWIVEPGDIPGALGSTISTLPPNFIAALQDDLDPDEIADPTTGLYGLETEEEDLDLPDLALRIQTQWHLNQQESQNQLLRWSTESLTREDVRQLLKAITPSSRPTTLHVLASRIAWHASLVCAKSFGSVLDNLTLADSLTSPVRSNIEFILDAQAFRIATTPPTLVALAQPEGIAAWNRRNHIHLGDRLNFGALINALLEEQPIKTGAPLFDQLDQPVRDAIRKGTDDVSLWLKKHRLTRSRIASALPRQLLSSSGDLAAIALWSDWLPAHARTIIHYLTPRASQIEAQISAALTSLTESDSPTRLLEPANEDTTQSFSEPGRRVGAPKFPTSQQVRSLVSEYEHRLTIDPGNDLRAVRAYSNTYTTYFAFFLTAALGYRARIDPSPVMIEIDSTSFAFFRDKDSEGYHRRIVAVPESFRAQHQAYLEHRRLMRAAFPDEWPTDTDPGVPWFSGGQVVPFEPRFAVLNADACWPYPINALRRRMRTLLFERGAPGEVADIWMGHWKIGNCPWMTGSGFEVNELKAMVRDHVSPILDEDGWIAIPSLLTADPCQI